MKRIRLLRESFPALQAIQSWFYSTHHLSLALDDVFVFAVNSIDSNNGIDLSGIDWKVYSKVAPEQYKWLYVKQKNDKKFNEAAIRFAGWKCPLNIAMSAATIVRAASLPYNNKPLIEAMAAKFGYKTKYPKTNHLLVNAKIDWDGLSAYYNRVSYGNLPISTGVEDWSSFILGE